MCHGIRSCRSAVELSPPDFRFPFHQISIIRLKSGRKVLQKVFAPNKSNRNDMID
jgi:hypothetical protein